MSKRRIRKEIITTKMSEHIIAPLKNIDHYNSAPLLLRFDNEH